MCRAPVMDRILTPVTGPKRREAHVQGLLRGEEEEGRLHPLVSASLWRCLWAFRSKGLVFHSELPFRAKATDCRLRSSPSHSAFTVGGSRDGLLVHK